MYIIFNKHSPGDVITLTCCREKQQGGWLMELICTLAGLELWHFSMRYVNLYVMHLCDVLKNTMLFI